VTEWVADRGKKWRMTGEPRLIILGGFEMSFALTAVDSGTRLVLTIGYDSPIRGFGRLFGFVFARAYARRCARQMAQGAQIAMRRSA
jgi:hypothetical protein